MISHLFEFFTVQYLLIIICLSCVCFIIGYERIIIKHNYPYDPLSHPILFGNLVRPWQVTHFLFYYTLAYVIPGQLTLVFWVSLVWELFECSMTNCGSHFWKGTVYDLIPNNLGYFLGTLVITYQWHKVYYSVMIFACLFWVKCYQILFNSLQAKNNEINYPNKANVGLMFTIPVVWMLVFTSSNHF